MTTEENGTIGRVERATRGLVREAGGEPNDAAVAEIMAMEPTEEELEVALALSRGEGDLILRKHYRLTTRIHRLFDLLTGIDAAPKH